MQPKERLFDVAALNDPRNLMSNPAEYRYHHRGLHITTLQNTEKATPVITAALHAQLHWGGKRTPICVVRSQIWCGNFQQRKDNEPYCCFSNQMPPQTW